MELLEAAFLIVTCVIINGIATLLFVKLAIRKLGLSRFIRLGKQFASSMGTQSQVVQHDRKFKALQQGAKEKVMKGAIASLPGGSFIEAALAKAQISPDEIFALMQDENFVKGLLKIKDTVGGLIGKISGGGEGGESKGKISQDQFG